ncbi:MAG: diguanylate cyclase, partial [Phyllobacteriaceae bacterium]|nr:diguanylate cyclase [Phyllobacteriaceae bacterium]
MFQAGADTQRTNWPRTMLVPALVAIAVLLVAGVLLDRQNHQIIEARLRAETLAQLSVIRAKLEGNVSSNIQLVKGLVATISTEPDMDQARYAALAQNLFVDDSQLRSVAAAPDLVVTMTYPYEPNRGAIGLDYRENAAQWDAVRRVMETGQLSVAGPVELVQGGQAFVGRFPVYTGEDEDRRFWGVISAILDVDKLYADSGLYAPGLNLDISITGQDGSGASGARFYGPDLSGLSPVTASVVLPAGSWRLAAVPKGGWTPDNFAIWSLRLMLLAAAALVLLPIVITARMIGQRHDHIRELRAREAELSQVTRRLNLALDVSKIGVWELDPVTGEEHWDDRTYEVYGLTPDGKKRSNEEWLNLVHPADRERAEADVDRIIREGGYESDYRIIHSDGGIRHIRSVASLFHEPGQSAKVIGVNWDVTADVARNESLREATQIARARNAELETARIRIEHNALHDSLTGLPNRRYLDEVLKRHAADGYHGSGSIALLHIDLDRFKQINDTLGHAAGDAMLIHASRILRENCRETDFVARIGGDEFVIVSSAGASDKRLA